LSDALLRARAVARRFGTQVALEPTDVDVNAGEALALIGPNGAGKSTLLALLAGALEPSAGTIERVDDVQVGWVPQRTAFYDRLTARENLELFARLEGEPDHAGVAEQLLERFEVPHTRSRSGTASA
jgi:ABC-2 type transport system ATP-binding protein